MKKAAEDKNMQNHRVGKEVKRRRIVNPDQLNSIVSMKAQTLKMGLYSIEDSFSTSTNRLL